MTDNIESARIKAQAAAERAQKADEALHKAEATQAQAEASQAEQKRIQDDGKNAERWMTYKEFLAPIKQAQEAFEAAVRDGGDTVTAFINLRKAEAIARTEHEAVTGWKYSRQHRAYETAVSTLRPLIEAMQGLRQEAARNRWSFPADYPAEFKQRVAELNEEINDAAKAYKSDYRRDLTSVGDVFMLDIVDTKPSRFQCAPAGTIPPEQRDATPYHVALEDAIRKVATEAGAEHGRTRLS